MERTGRSGKDQVNQAGVDGTEGGRRPTEVPTTTADAASAGKVPQEAPNPEVMEKPIRRRFTAEYKLRILQEADLCAESGRLGALLRREGLYSSHLTTWRRQRDEGCLSALSPKKRGRKLKRADPLVQENHQLRHELQRLRDELKKSQTIIEVQKKLCDLLETPRETSDSNGIDE